MQKLRILGAVIGLSTLCVGFFGAGYILHRQPTITEAATFNQQYPLLAKRLFMESPNDHIINFAELREGLEEYYSSNHLGGTLYFEYLPTGTSIHVGDKTDEKLVAASLMKTPVVMELYRAAELHRVSLDQPITLKQEWLDNGYGTLYQKGAGYSLTLRQAAEMALAQSDNTAINAILGSTKNMLQPNETSVNALDVSYTRDQDLALKINAWSYTSFLKCLYFSCYLDHNNSEQILQFLSHSNAQTRLRAGVPAPITVAHKIGTHANSNQSDCGIIYEPNRNYALCIMIKGPEGKVSDEQVAYISSMVYKFVHTAGMSKAPNPN